ncbi:NAD(P)-dependent dehydrogenase (short-subunit alcohol dehydrogenase family) [Microbacterium sp. W4I4]|uniref:oxidoreductase n=1 Tax=Microbacterium sp. W4I4 TaxID=3042295 RepID=UPI0027899CE1|nr:oxidoreductase [Microbacterium sp. W4I4]MDQ0613912.1 NAD(P)-dependent dehydrogenase (short-subunit alcohol dehydrogenase family) [Microbacterium sp. W4I4]
MSTISSPSQLSDQTGRTVVITGAGSGIGRAAANAFAARGARVILAVRDLDKGRDAADAMDGSVEARSLDLASLASVHAFVDGVQEPVDILVNNAGAMTGSRTQTRDGFESQFGVNHLGHFALTNLLLDRIGSRVVTVTSSAHSSARIDFDDLQWERRAYRPFGAYGQSKLANLLFTAELQRRLTGIGSSVIATAAHPGWASTGFRISSGNRVLDALMALSTPLLAHGPDGGALPTLLAAAGEVPAGGFAGPSRMGGVRGPAAVVEPAAQAKDPDVARRLWDVSERLTGTRFPLVASAEA